MSIISIFPSIIYRLIRSHYLLLLITQYRKYGVSLRSLQFWRVFKFRDICVRRSGRAESTTRKERAVAPAHKCGLEGPWLKWYWHEPNEWRFFNIYRAMRPIRLAWYIRFRGSENQGICTCYVVWWDGVRYHDEFINLLIHHFLFWYLFSFPNSFHLTWKPIYV